MAIIYAIRNIVTGKPRDCYIGSTVRVLAKRIAQHLARLRCGKHHSIRLQGAFKKYGEAAFEFVVLETCPLERRFERETHWIDAVKPRFNILPAGGSLLGHRWKLSDETRAKMAAYHRNRPASHRKKLKEARQHQVLKAPRKLGRMCFPGWKQSAEAKAKISAAMRLRGPRSEGTKEKIRRGNLGQKRSAESRARMSAAAKLREARKTDLTRLASNRI